MKFYLLLVLAATLGFVPRSHSYFHCNLDEYESESSCKSQCRFPINDGNSSIPGRCAVSYSFEPKNAPPDFNPTICWKCYNDRHPSMDDCTPNNPKCPEAQSTTSPVTDSPSNNWKHGLPKPNRRKHNFPTTPSPMHNQNDFGSTTTNFEGRDLPEPDSSTPDLPPSDKDWEAEFTSPDVDEGTEFTTPDMDEENYFTTPYFDEDNKCMKPDIDEETDFPTPDVDDETEFTALDLDDETEFTTPDLDDETEFTAPDLDDKTEFLAPDLDDETEFTAPDVEATDFPDYEITEPDFPPQPFSESEIESDESATGDSPSYEIETTDLPDYIDPNAPNSNMI